MDLIYQEVYCSNISNGIFEDMKIDPRNKWRKIDSLSLDRNSTDIAINDKWKISTQAPSIEIYDFRIYRFEIVRGIFI